MTFEDYSANVSRHAIYPMQGANVIYPAMGVSGEAGELLDKIKKHWRNSVVNPNIGHETVFYMDAATLTFAQKAEIVKEIGDVLWYCNALCKELGTTLDFAAQMNMVKLADRAKRNQIKSEGDNR